jgi:flagellar motor protein MotB
MALLEAAEEATGESYFASVSDLMVGILFVFLLMLTVFALNFRDAEQDQRIERARYEEAVKRQEVAERRKLDAEALAKKEAALAAAQRAENDRLRLLLNDAVAQLEHDIEDRAEARNRLLTSLERALTERGIRVSVDSTSGVLRLSEDLLFKSGESSIQREKLPTLLTLAEVLSRILPCYADGGNRTGCNPTAAAILETVLVEGHTDRQGFKGRVAPKSDRPVDTNQLLPAIGQRADSRNVRPEFIPLSLSESQARNDLLSTERALAVFKELRKAQPSLDGLRNGSHVPLLGVSGYGERRPVPDAQGTSAEDFKKNRRIDLRFVLSARTSEELRRLQEQIRQALDVRP